MKHIYRLEYNCYKQQMRILLDGVNAISSYSSLIQYMNEPFYVWSDKIIQMLYEEIEETYVLEYIGTLEEAEIIEQAAVNSPYCVEFHFAEPELNMPAIYRFQNLNETLHKSPRTIEAVFYTDDKWMTENEIKGTTQSLIGHGNFIFESLSSCVLYNGLPAFVIATSDACLTNSVFHYPNYPFIFLLLRGEQNSFIRQYDNVFIYSVSSQNVEDALKKCFNLFVLPQYLYSTIEGLLTNNGNKKLKLLLETNPSIAELHAPKILELGERYHLDITMNPSTAPIPELAFSCQFPGIVAFDQNMISPLGVGKTKVWISVKGEATGIGELCFEVIRRNRIKDISFEFNDLTIAVDDQISLEWEYSPENGDDYGALHWTSSNTDIATVDQNGLIKAICEGQCEISLAAERASACCQITVKPRLRNIVLPLELRSHIYQMFIGQRLKITCQIEPQNAVDSELIYTTDDYKIVKVTYDGVLIAQQEGKTFVRIRNRENTVCERIEIVVGNGKPKPKSMFEKIKEGLERIGIYI